MKRQNPDRAGDTAVAEQLNTAARRDAREQDAYDQSLPAALPEPPCVPPSLSPLVVELDGQSRQRFS